MRLLISILLIITGIGTYTDTDTGIGPSLNATSLQKAQTNRQFRFTLAEKLVAGIVASLWGPGHPPIQSISCLTGKHFPYRHGTRPALLSVCL